MIRKLSFLIGLGTGYVLGAKAGTQRYEEILGKARDLAGMPAVQEATSTLSAAAGTAAEKAAGKARAKVEEVVDLNGSGAPAKARSAAGGPVSGATTSASAPDVAAR